MKIIYFETKYRRKQNAAFNNHLVYQSISFLIEQNINFNIFLKNDNFN